MTSQVGDYTFRQPFSYSNRVQWFITAVIFIVLFRFSDTLTNWPGQDDNTIMNLYATQYEQLQITCDLNNINYTSNFWQKNGQLVETIDWNVNENPSRFHLANKRHHPFSNRFYLDHRGSLIIDTVRLEDNGRWHCQAFDENQQLLKSKVVNLIVYDVPKNPYFLIDNRILDPNNNFIAVRENAEVSVSCVVDNGNPKPKLEWSLKINHNTSTNRDLYETTSDLNMTDIVDQNQQNGARSDVHFRRISRAHHNATITCLVYHMALKVPLNISLFINVQYVPSFIISRIPGFGIPIIKGMAISLKCEVDSNPPSEPFWQMNDHDPPVKQNGNGFLNFSSIRMAHKGWYKCLSKHVYGQFASTSYFLNVRDKLSILEQQQEQQEQTIEFKKSLEHQDDFSDVDGLTGSKKRQIEVTLGGAVQLQCPPGTTGCWSKVNRDTNGLDPLGSAQELKLDRIIYEEAGEYRCVAPNADRKHQLDSLKDLYSVEVTVIGQPVIFNRNQSFNIVSQRTSWNMSFDFCANPPYERSFWIVGDRVVKPGQKLGNSIKANFIQKTISQYCHRAILTFSYVTIRNSGQYLFLVGSPRGLAEGYIYLNVTQNLTDPEFMGFSDSAASFRYRSQKFVVWLFFANIFILFGAVK